MVANVVNLLRVFGDIKVYNFFITSFSDIAIFASLQPFNSSEKVSNRLGENMDSVCLLLEIRLTFQGKIIKSLESVCKIGRESIFSVSVLMMIFLFWFSSFKSCICSRRPSMYIEEVSISEGPEFFTSFTDF